jgi:hypothetical protein
MRIGSHSHPSRGGYHWMSRNAGVGFICSGRELRRFFLRGRPTRCDLMEYQVFHPRDEQLLQEIDGELPPRAVRRIQSHLRACWRHELEHAITTFIRARQLEFDNPLAPETDARELLKSRLVQLPMPPVVRAGWWSWRGSLRALSGAACCALTLFIWIGIRHNQPHRKSTSVSIPGSSLTPGATILADTQEVCALGNAANKSVTPTLRNSVFKEYGIPTAEPGAYEIDYLITPGLGGADDIRNLWPHSYSSKWNARVKDKLEYRLHDLVCSGNLNLAQAQREIATNWIVAYKKYFHTDRSLPDETAEAMHIAVSH